MDASYRDEGLKTDHHVKLAAVWQLFTNAPIIGPRFTVPIL
jgi:hypothetical protein